MCRRRVSDATTVFVKSHISSIVQAVLDSPVSSYKLCESVFISFIWHQAGDAVSDLVALCSVSKDDFPFYCKYLGCMREVNLFGFDGTRDCPSAFNATVVLLIMPFLPGKKKMAATFVWLSSATRVGSS